MQPRYISPKDLANTRFGHLYQTSVQSQLIYVGVLVFTISILLALPFVYITITTKGFGQIASSFERVDLIAPISGIVSAVNIKDNQQVAKGDLLISIDASSNHAQRTLINQNLMSINKYLTDLYQLSKSTDSPKLKTSMYMANWHQYVQELAKTVKLVERNTENYNKYKRLYLNKAVSESEYEQYLYDYEQSLTEKRILIEKFRKQWETEAEAYKTKLVELVAQSENLNIQTKQSTINSPIKGSLQNIKGLHVGSPILSGQKIAEISPDGNLLAICYLKPADIGFIKIKQTVNFQLDAFDYRYWGTVKGLVLEISDEAIIINNSPFFKVKCLINSYTMHLENGFTGQVRKGMTFIAHFALTRRTLFQLIYDQIDDWVNPKGM